MGLRRLRPWPTDSVDFALHYLVDDVRVLSALVAQSKNGEVGVGDYATPALCYRSSRCPEDMA